MIHARPVSTPSPTTAPRVSYRFDALESLLQQRGTLAVIGFEHGQQMAQDDPRWLNVALPGLENKVPLEHWQVDADVEHGREGVLRFAHGGGWLFCALQVAEADHDGDIGDTAAYAYRTLCDFLSREPGKWHVQRLWNYLDRINEGEGDAERYKHFCDGRLRGMGNFFVNGFPAATAIGQPHAAGHLTLYCLASTRPGTRIENPRQMSAWRYPRQYGRTAPSFARAMRLPGKDALAISGTAAITGHESRHADDLEAQLQELAANLDVLLDTAHMPPGFDQNAPLKVYLRQVQDTEAVGNFLDRHMPDAPRLVLQGDVCRRELLVEIDGWRYA